MTDTTSEPGRESASLMSARRARLAAELREVAVPKGSESQDLMAARRACLAEELAELDRERSR